jgi:hypothetical protein
MSSASLASPHRESRFVGLAVVLTAMGIALVSARPYAGSWNDGSRLAAVEALVDHHRFAIDDSIFVQPPPADPRAPTPYLPDEPLVQHGTNDKLFIDGHYYSDKPAVISLLMAGVYQAWQWCGGATASARPDLFCLLMTLATSGLAYVVTVGCSYRLGHALGLPVGVRVALAASLGLATVALPYSRHVNNHIMLLAVAMALFLALARLAEAVRGGRTSWFQLAWLGTLAGLGYNLDLGTGPMLLLCLTALLAYRCRQPAPLAVFGLATLPWLVTHHLINYALGGTFKPMNAVPAYSLWPGCPFTAENLTGAWNHTPGHFFVYIAGMLAGKRGFLGHNLPLFLALPALVILLRRCWAQRLCEKGPDPLNAGGQTPFRTDAQRAELIFAGWWAGGTWLLYGALSNNYSGVCCTVRWFVPLLAPGYFALALLLRDYPDRRRDFYVLSGWGAILGGLMWWQGPWMGHMVPCFWPIQGAALLSWYGLRRRPRSPEMLTAQPGSSSEPTARAA